MVLNIIKIINILIHSSTNQQFLKSLCFTVTVTAENDYIVNYTAQ